jgi:hypothetical protein
MFTPFASIVAPHKGSPFRQPVRLDSSNAYQTNGINYFWLGMLSSKPLHDQRGSGMLGGTLDPRGE